MKMFLMFPRIQLTYDDTFPSVITKCNDKEETLINCVKVCSHVKKLVFTLMSLVLIDFDSFLKKSIKFCNV